MNTLGATAREIEIAADPLASLQNEAVSFVERAVAGGAIPSVRVARLGYRCFARVQAFPIFAGEIAQYWVTAAPLCWERFETATEPVMRRTLLGKRVPKTRRGDDFEAPRVPVTRTVTIRHGAERVSGVRFFRSAKAQTGADGAPMDSAVEPDEVARALTGAGVASVGDLRGYLVQTLHAIPRRGVSGAGA
jgi:hypothetical protein